MTEEHQEPIEEQAAPAPATSSRHPWRTLLVIGLFLIIACAGLAGYCYWALFHPARLAGSVDVKVPLKTTLRVQAMTLQQQGLIPSAWVFRLYAKFTGKSNKLKAGEYDITNGMRPVDILNLLISGRTKADWLRVPEGKWASEISPLLTEHWPGDVREFTTLVKDARPWKTRFPFIADGNLEGYLFPSTYLISKDATAKQIVNQMLLTFKGQCWELYKKDSPADGRSFHDVLVLASLVEAEAKKDDERARIAGVYQNRLHKGMKLECDATILYAKGARLKRVLYRDLEVDSPYNTYRYPGLPSGPICNPGLLSVKAALHPEQHGYLYYVARGDGSHKFSSTFSEHQAAIREIRGE